MKNFKGAWFRPSKFILKKLKITLTYLQNPPNQHMIQLSFIFYLSLMFLIKLYKISLLNCMD